ncbi:MipA/OmpV family protein [Vibrio fujianensis]|uniref:MipA/OmpV family protein n=1 Tax=Vibrio fujianensis TaxID=1974215 RepID=UPI003CCB7AB7
MRYLRMKRRCFFSFLLISSAVNAEVSQWSLGLAAAYSPAVYKDTPSNRTVIPVIGYEGEHIFLRGFDAGYRLFPRGASQNIVFRVAFDPRTLKPSDSDDPQIRLLDKRKATVLGGVSYQLYTMLGMWEASIGSDIAGRHNGVYGELAWRFPLRFKGWGITPAIGYAYNSDNLNNHLYGVSAQEAVRSGLEKYDANWEGQYFVGASAYWAVAHNIRISGGVRYTNLAGGISESPVVGRDAGTMGTIGIVYLF